jgi:hypothetical protein
MSSPVSIHEKWSGPAFNFPDLTMTSDIILLEQQ